MTKEYTEEESLQLITALKNFQDAHSDIPKMDSFENDNYNSDSSLIMNSAMLSDALVNDNINRDLSELSEIILFKYNMEMFEEDADYYLDKNNEVKRKLKKIHNER